MKYTTKTNDLTNLKLNSNFIFLNLFLLKYLHFTFVVLSYQRPYYSHLALE